MTVYSEVYADEDDVEVAVINALTEGRPWVLLSCEADGAEGLSIRATVGGGVTSVALVKKLLRMATDAIPDEKEAAG